MTVSTNVPRERWNQPHEREHPSHDSHMYVGEDLWRCDQCGEALT